MKRGSRILVATDLRKSADEALRQGARLANQSNGTLGVVHVIKPVMRGDATRANELRRHELIVRARITKVLGPTAVQVFIEEGVDHAEIGRRALEWCADIVVVGARSPSILGHLFRGVGERLIREAHCAVLVARPSVGHGGVIAATDLSKPTLPAVVAGVLEAEQRRTHLKVVHAIASWSVEARYLLSTSKENETQSDFAAFVEELESAVAQIGLDEPCQVLTGPAARAIVRDAATSDAELVVVAKRTVPPAQAGLLSRGVAEDVFASAPCSVLVVRAPARSRGSSDSGMAMSG